MSTVVVRCFEWFELSRIDVKCLEIANQFQNNKQH